MIIPIRQIGKSAPRVVPIPPRLRIAGNTIENFQHPVLVLAPAQRRPDSRYRRGPNPTIRQPSPEAALHHPSHAMSATRFNVPDAAARGLLEMMVSRLSERCFEIELWDGLVWPCPSQASPQFRLRFRSPAAVHKLLTEPGARGFGEAFVQDLVDVEGSLIGVFSAAEEMMRLEWTPADRLRFAGALALIPRPGSPPTGRYGGLDLTPSTDPAMSRQDSVNYHYDHTVDFWRLWLDESLSYSCAYFESEDVPLGAAQAAKLDLVCRKLRLRPGMRLLDVGCGWGALVRHAVSHYGVDAVGITLSPRQAEVARERLHNSGWAHLGRIEVGDFLELSGPDAFDRIVSVGSVEHVPEAVFGDYFRRAFALLKPGGQFLNHGITRNPGLPDRPGPSFMDHYVFPNHYLAPIGGTVTAAEATGFEVRDVESLREHYTLTLRHWLGRFEAARAGIESLVGKSGYRIFRLYLAGSAHEFLRGRLNLHQTLLVKPVAGASGIPLTRADWYANGPADPAGSDVPPV